MGIKGISIATYNNLINGILKLAAIQFAAIEAMRYSSWPTPPQHISNNNISCIKTQHSIFQ